MSKSTREAVDTIASNLVINIPGWCDKVRERAAQGMSYRAWRKEFQGFIDEGYLRGIIHRSRKRGEDQEELLRCFWEATRRAAGVPVKDEECEDDEDI